MTALPAARRVDLHLHSDRSDGKHPPEEVLKLCAEGGLDVVALTDHDLTHELACDEDGTFEAGGRRVRVIGGAELTGVHDGHELHLLVYFPRAVPAAFRAFCTERSRARAERYDAAVRNLALEHLDPPDAAAWAGERALTRHHLARALVAAGHAQDMRDAFRRFIDARLGTVPQVDLPFTEAIRVARAHGGVTSWAHPPMSMLERYLPEFAAAGLHALEGIRGQMTSEGRRRVRKFAAAHGLFLTGGSDWHGFHDGRPGMFYVERPLLHDFFAALDASAP
jgi:predicted metal-dependent phosphoesterase TrpH